MLADPEQDAFRHCEPVPVSFADGVYVRQPFAVVDAVSVSKRVCDAKSECNSNGHSIANPFHHADAEPHSDADHYSGSDPFRDDFSIRNCQCLAHALCERDAVSQLNRHALDHCDSVADAHTDSVIDGVRERQPYGLSN